MLPPGMRAGKLGAAVSDSEWSGGRPRAPDGRDARYSTDNPGLVIGNLGYHLKSRLTPERIPGSKLDR